MGNVLSLRKLFESTRSQLEKSLRRASIRLSKDEQFPLDDIYVELTLLSAKQLESLFESSSFSSRSEHDGIGSVPAGEHAAALPRVTFNELFENVRGDNPCRSMPIQNILAYGGAGSGKTTAFLLVLVYEWLRGCVLSGKFDLMLSFELRDKDVQKAESLDQLFFLQLESLGYGPEEGKELATELSRNLDFSRLCLIFDGLDECDLESCSRFMRKLLDRKAVTPAHVIVTSRPCPAANELKKTGNYQRHLEVVGFPVEKVHEYVLKALDREAGEKMLEELKKNPRMASLMSTPLFAALACDQYKRGKGLPKGATSLFSALLCGIIEKKTKDYYSSLEKIPNAEMQVSTMNLLKLCRKVVVQALFKYTCTILYNC